MTNLEMITAGNAVLTAVVAVVGVRYLWRQTRTASNAVKLQLFERRLSAFEGITSVLGEIFATGRTSIQLDHDFLMASRYMGWLFDDKIARLVSNDIWEVLSRLAAYQSIAEGPDGEERTRAIEKGASAKKDLMALRGQLTEAVSPYMRLGD